MTTRTTISLDDLLKLPAEEMLRYDETPTIEDLRTRQQVYFDDIAVGMELPKYIKRYSTIDLLRWCVTMENTHRIHYDLPFAVNHDKVPGVLFQGSWRGSILTAWLKNWTLPNGWPWKERWQVREMVVANEVTIVWGRVTGTQVRDGMGMVELELGIKNQDGTEGCPGSATVAMPVRGGREIPYPFVPPKD